MKFKAVKRGDFVFIGIRLVNVWADLVEYINVQSEETRATCILIITLSIIITPIPILKHCLSIMKKSLLAMVSELYQRYSTPISPRRHFVLFITILEAKNLRNLQ